MSGSRVVTDYSAPPGTPPQMEPVSIYTRVWGRSPMWKAHTSLRAARAALAYHRRGPSWGHGRAPELWEWADGAWHLRSNPSPTD